MHGEINYRKEGPVLIKVNLIAKKSWETGAVTDPVVVEGLIRFLRKKVKELYVVESNATFTNADKAVQISGILGVCENLDIPFINLSKLEDKKKIPIPGYEALSSITVPDLVLQSDIISAAKLKTHTETSVTLSLKNMFGLLPERFKAKYHLRGISKVVVDINTVLKPTLSIIDGFIAMEGKGPVHGRPRKMDTIIVGGNPIATDAVAARIMDFNPHNIYHIRRLAEKNSVDIDKIDIIGTPLAEVKIKFSSF